MSTTKRLLSCVRPHVSLQQPGSLKPFPTHLALMVQVMCENMHLQGWHAHIELVADVVGLGILGTQNTMGLLVTG